MKNLFKVVTIISILGTTYCVGYISCAVDGIKVFVKLYNKGYTLDIVPIEKKKENKETKTNA